MILIMDCNVDYILTEVVVYQKRKQMEWDFENIDLIFCKKLTFLESLSMYGFSFGCDCLNAMHKNFKV